MSRNMGSATSDPATRTMAAIWIATPPWSLGLTSLFRRRLGKWEGCLIVSRGTLRTGGRIPARDRTASRNRSGKRALSPPGRPGSPAPGPRTPGSESGPAPAGAYQRHGTAGNFRDCGNGNGDRPRGPRAPLRPRGERREAQGTGPARGGVFGMPFPPSPCRPPVPSSYFRLSFYPIFRMNPTGATLQHPDGHDDHRKTREHQLLLREERGMVVEQPVEEALLLEHELPREEYGVGEIRGGPPGGVGDDLDHLRPHLAARLRVIPVPLDELDVVLELSAQVPAQVLHLVRPLERAGVDDPRREEHEVAEGPGERPDEGEKDVHAEAVVPGHHEDGRGGGPRGGRLLRGRNGDRRGLQKQFV